MKRQRKPRKGPAKGSDVVRGSLPKNNVAVNVLRSTESVGPVFTCDIPMTPTPTTLAAGAMATAVQLSSALIPAFSTRFGATFLEYRIIGARWRIRQSDSFGVNTGAGVSVFYLDEKDTAVPTAAKALDHARIEISNESDSNDKTISVEWIAHDLTDLQWTAIGTAFTPVTLKAFCDAANFQGSGAQAFLATGTARFQFRGLQ